MFYYDLHSRDTNGNISVISKGHQGKRATVAPLAAAWNWANTPTAWRANSKLIGGTARASKPITLKACRTMTSSDGHRTYFYPCDSLVERYKAGQVDETAWSFASAGAFAVLDFIKNRRKYDQEIETRAEYAPALPCMAYYDEGMNLIYYSVGSQPAPGPEAWLTQERYAGQTIERELTTASELRRKIKYDTTAIH
ncbi:hypothetical protein EFR44_03270 [Lactobacillus delbrueckii subsp. lactis]|uniref:hypothetical protein n=1 Tax=Lactobacillus delbrueckii TaxID=1584 RepID=UPI0021A87099|nr:hypothetical protein [Lactobacillus delbrueckii]MCT3489843.1 hypothetical protein [Lactobacillus delbrueckii subsp. lactis]